MSRGFTPAEAEARRLQVAATAAQRAGAFDRAGPLFERALALTPDRGESWAGLAECLLAARRPEEAVAVCDAGLRRIAEDPTLLTAKARAAQSLSRVAEAAALFRRALDRDAAFAPARYGLALQAVEIGDWDAAAALAAPLIAAGAPGPDLAWLAARIALGRGEPAVALAGVAGLLAVGGLTAEQRAEILLLQGQSLERLGRYAAAFAAAAQAKALLRGHFTERAASGEGETAKYRRLAAWFAAADPADWRGAPVGAGEAQSASAGHAFLLGFPRSGTTLLEQALAGHSGVVSLEEAPTLAAAGEAFLGSDAGLERLARLDRTEAARWRNLYWREVAARGVDPTGKLFLDKAPAGDAWLPLIAKLFPVAKVIFALRDPRDVALSCFRAGFQMNALTYAFTSLTETADCYDACMTMAQALRAVLPLDVLETRHETLVGDFAGGLGAVCAFLGLDFESAMLDVAATARRRNVRTPSASQVRAGLNAEGLGRWRRHRADLAPILTVLAPWVDHFGYPAD